MGTSIRRMLTSTLGLVVGLAALTWAADQFVLGAVRVSARLRLSMVLIGAVVVGFGTSAPEMVVSGLAARQGELDIAVGNIIGSNVANLSLVLGAAALVVPILVASPNIRREAPLSLAGTILFALLVQNGLTATEGLILLIVLVAIISVIVVGSMGGPDEEITSEVEEFLEDGDTDLRREVIRTLIGIIVTVVSAQVLVESATGIAAELGLAEGFVGVSIVALGTSLPELATSLQAARKSETDLIVGNLLGSNLFNSLAVGAVAALAGPGSVEDVTLTGRGIGIMLAVSVLATVFMATGRRVVRWEGGMLLIMWVVMLPLLCLLYTSPSPRDS